VAEPFFRAVALEFAIRFPHAQAIPGANPELAVSGLEHGVDFVAGMPCSKPKFSNRSMTGSGTAPSELPRRGAKLGRAARPGASPATSDSAIR